jgi:SAM-dependent methyltransferase
MSPTREDARDFWQALATGCEREDPASLAGLALCGTGDRYDLYRHRAERKAVASLLPQPGSDWRVLDVGCGPGRWTVPLAQTCREVVAVDFSESMLAHASRECERAGVAGKVTFRRERVQELDCAVLGQPFDLVLVVGLLQYVPEEELHGVYPRLAACVRPGGLLLHRETRTRKPTEKAYPGVDGLTMRAFYRPFETYRSAFEKHGFRLKARRSVIPPSPAYSLYSRLCPPGRPAPLKELPLRAILGTHELLIDPLWRLFPGVLWLVNSRRPTDQVAALYVKTGD